MLTKLNIKIRKQKWQESVRRKNLVIKLWNDAKTPVEYLQPCKLLLFFVYCKPPFLLFFHCIPVPYLYKCYSCDSEREPIIIMCSVENNCRNVLLHWCIHLWGVIHLSTDVYALKDTFFFFFFSNSIFFRELNVIFGNCEIYKSINLNDS